MTYFERLMATPIFKPVVKKAEPRIMLYSFTRRFPVYLDDKIVSRRIEIIGVNSRIVKAVGNVTLLEFIQKYRSSYDLMKLKNVGVGVAQQTMDIIYEYMLSYIRGKDIQDYLKLVDEKRKVKVAA